METLGLPNQARNEAFVRGLRDIAVRFNYRMYLMWRYPAPEPGQSTVLYTVATLDWTVYFRASGTQTLGFANAAGNELPHATGPFRPADHSDPLVAGQTFNLGYRAR